MRNHFWVLFLSPHGFCSSLSDSQPQLAGDGCPQPQLAGDGCPQLFSYQEPHRETVMNQFQSPVPRRGRVWLSLGQVSLLLVQPAVVRGRGHTMAMGIIPMGLALEVGSAARRGNHQALYPPKDVSCVCILVGSAG